MNFLTLTNGGRGQTPTAFQRDSYPEWARSSISILPEGVDLEGCKPSPETRRRTFKLGDVSIAPRKRLVTYVSRDLEPYRGFHTMMRALPRLFDARADVHVIMVGGDGVSYGAKLADGRLAGANAGRGRRPESTGSGCISWASSIMRTTSGCSSVRTRMSI